MLLFFFLEFLLCSARIPYDQRDFHSDAIDAVVANYTSLMTDPVLSAMFENCFPNTLDTTVEYFDGTPGNQDAFIITGDIDAQWLRDSTNQVLPYIPYALTDLHLRDLICGLVHRQATQVLNDAFANAFNINNSNAGHHSDQVKPPMTPMVYESKYELDSLAAVLKLSWNYYFYTNDTTCFDWQSGKWMQSVQTIINTITTMQAGTNDEGTAPTYTFQRETTVASDTQFNGGRGQPVRRCGLSKSPFRGSDDATLLPFLIPSNIMSVVELRHVATMLALPSGPTSNPTLATTATTLANTIDSAVKKYAIADNFVTSIGTNVPVYAYEVDGYGGKIFMDDANIPSLLSLPYLGYLSLDDATYQNTRAMLLSYDNPYFWSGKAGSGIGGPHVGYGYVWPMSIIMRGLTTTDDKEVSDILNALKNSTAGTDFMHESFWKDDATQYTRSWFAWANSLFGEFILVVGDTKPYLIF